MPTTLAPRFALAVIVALASLNGCASITTGPVVDGGPLRRDGHALIEQPTRVGELVVTPKRVVEDSRCPMNARCVWAGRVILETRIDGAGWRETVNLTLGETYRMHNSALALTSVAPEKIAGSAQPRQPYLFGFEAR